MRSSKQEYVTIIMSTYKEPLEYIVASTQSIIHQTYKYLQFIIVIDDPNNIEAVEYLKQLSKEDSRVVLVIHTENKGIVKSLNDALSISTGKYIARMDADDISFSDRIEVQLNYLKKNKCDLVGSNVINIDSFGNAMSESTHFPYEHKHIINYYKYGVCLPHPTWLAKKDVFESLSGYREIKACEDYDFIVRGIQKGFVFGLVEKPLLKYRINLSGISSSNKAVQKVSFLFLSSNYKSNTSISEADYNTYICSALAQTRIHKLNEFYRFRDSKQINMTSLRSIVFNRSLIVLIYHEFAKFMLMLFK